MVIHEKAYAKLNLSLDVLSRMEDGYHSMLMVLQSADLSDDVTIEITSGSGIYIDTDLRYIPSDSRNIAWKAADLFLKETGINGCRLDISIKKRIPVCAGMGGGSADAAAVLRALNKGFNTDLNSVSLMKLAEQIGSDVPFCIYGGTALAEGRGEILTELPPLPKCYILICKPKFSVSTPELFALIDCKKITCRPDTAGILEALSEGSLNGVCRRMYNVFEPVLPSGIKTVTAIKQIMLENDALGAVMTGTGSAVFGVFSNEGFAKNAADRLSAEYGRCYLSSPVNRIEAL